MSTVFATIKRAIFGCCLAAAIGYGATTVGAVDDTCCTQCSCVQLCCSFEGCESGGYICGASGCTRTCEGETDSYRCADYCPPIE